MIVGLISSGLVAVAVNGAVPKPSQGVFFFSLEKTTLFWVGPAVICLDNRIYANQCISELRQLFVYSHS